MIKRALDEDGCIDLLAILRIMNQIGQEQAWALAYELAALMQRMWPAGNNCAIIESLAQIYIHHEGYIHEKSLWTIDMKRAVNTVHLNHPDQKQQQQQQQRPQQPQQNYTNIVPTATDNQPQHLPPTPPISPELSDEILRRRIAGSESELISSLGMSLFWALDYGIPDDQERKLNIAMEYLIFQSQKEMSLSELEQICIERLPVAKKSQADLHYRQVCKSLVQDTIELSIFLDKIYTATVALSGVDGNHHQFHLHHQLQTAISGGAAVGVGKGTHINHQSRKLDDDSRDYLKIAQKLADENTNNTAVNNNDTGVEQDVKPANCRNSVIAFRNHYMHDDELVSLGLPLASLRALKINDWARLWMQVIRELRQRGKIIAT